MIERKYFDSPDIVEGKLLNRGYFIGVVKADQERDLIFIQGKDLKDESQELLTVFNDNSPLFDFMYRNVGKKVQFHYLYLEENGTPKLNYLNILVEGNEFNYIGGHFYMIS